MIVPIARISARSCKTLQTAAQCFFVSRPSGINLTFVRTMTKITFESKHKEGACPGVLQGNVGSSKQGLIVLQEWWGLNKQIEEEAKMIGEMGDFVTLVPDLYRGKVADDKEEAGHLMGGLDWPGAIMDIEGAAKYLLSQGCQKVGVTGFCMGGALSLAAAALVKEISAAAPFYGIPGDQLCDLSTITIPVQAHFGEKDDIDGFSTPKDAEKMAEKVKQKCSDFELHMYPCGHAFTNATGPLGNYNKEECDKALDRMVKFMKKHL